MRVVKRAKTPVFADYVQYAVVYVLYNKAFFRSRVYYLHFRKTQRGGNYKGRNRTWCVCSLQVIFEHEGVFIHPGSDEDGIEQDLLTSGSLRIVDKVNLL